MNDRPLSPRELAELTSVSTDTLRHYERLGLLPAPRRTTGGYRRYAPAAVARVLLIQRALVVGLSLRELARVLRERDKGGSPCRSVRGLVADRLCDLDRRIDELVALRSELKTLLEDWDARLESTPVGHRARLLETLGDLPAIERARLAKRRARGTFRRWHSTPR
jgi:DNA-binding transcriptional MerR regulator